MVHPKPPFCTCTSITKLWKLLWCVPEIPPFFSNPRPPPPAQFYPPPPQICTILVTKKHQLVPFFFTK